METFFYFFFFFVTAGDCDEIQTLNVCSLCENLVWNGWINVWNGSLFMRFERGNNSVLCAVVYTELECIVLLEVYGVYSVTNGT